MKLNAKQLRSSTRDSSTSNESTRNDIYIILDNVLDTYNIGSVFRLSDAAGVKKVYLCGATNTPPNPRIKKASINTTEWVDWEYIPDTVELIKNLKFKIQNLQVVAVELHEKATPYNKFEYKTPLALIVGHETYGVSPEVLDMADAVVELPMYGVNVSLNVMVSLAIVLYKALE